MPDVELELVMDEPKKRGRPRLYPEDRAEDGAPKFTVRLAPDLHDWVMQAGGAAFVRSLIEDARRKQARQRGLTQDEG